MVHSMLVVTPHNVNSSGEKHTLVGTHDTICNVDGITVPIREGEEMVIEFEIFVGMIIEASPHELPDSRLGMGGNDDSRSGNTVCSVPPFDNDGRERIMYHGVR